jgi:hypothetical protein
VANATSGILHTSTSLSGERGSALLTEAVNALLSSVDVFPTPSVLWSAQYQQLPTSGTEQLPVESNRVLRFPPPALDLAFEDSTFDNVKEVWQKVLGDEASEFLVFKDREAYDDDE